MLELVLWSGIDSLVREICLLEELVFGSNSAQNHHEPRMFRQSGRIWHLQYFRFTILLTNCFIDFLEQCDPGWWSQAWLHANILNIGHHISQTRNLIIIAFVSLNFTVKWWEFLWSVNKKIHAYDHQLESAWWSCRIGMNANLPLAWLSR